MGVGRDGGGLGGGGGGGGLFYNHPARSEAQHLLGGPHHFRLDVPEVVRDTHITLRYDLIYVTISLTSWPS